MSAKMFTVGGKVATLFGKTKALSADTDNPLHLPPFTLRLRYDIGVTPVNQQQLGTLTQISQTPNIWDFTYENPIWGTEDWQGIVPYGTGLTVLGANTTDVTNMDNMFAMGYLQDTVVFDTSNVSSFTNAFYNAYVSAIPDFNVSKAVNVDGMFWNASDVVSGISAMYAKLSAVPTITSYSQCFRSCGVTADPQVAAERALIPTAWGGDQS